MTTFSIKRLGLLALLCLLGGAFSACVTLPPPKPAADNIIDKRFVAPPVGELIVLLPSTKQVGIESGGRHLRAQLIAQLTSAGYRVMPLDEARHQELWTQVATEVGGLYNPQTGTPIPKARASAYSKLAQRVCADMKCALLVQAELVRRQAKLSGDSAEWDGQRSRVKTIGDFGRNYTFSGSTPSISVEVRAVMANGDMGFRTHGGVALPYQSDVLKVQSVLRTDLFEDDREIASGLQIALAPLIPRQTQAEEAR